MSTGSAFQSHEEGRKSPGWALSSPSQEEATRVFPSDVLGLVGEVNSG